MLSLLSILNRAQVTEFLNNHATDFVQFMTLAVDEL